MALLCPKARAAQTLRERRERDGAELRKVLFLGSCHPGMTPNSPGTGLGQISAASGENSGCKVPVREC